MTKKKSSLGNKRNAPQAKSFTCFNPGEALDRAYAAYRENNLEEVVEILQGFNRNHLRKDRIIASEYYRLMIFALTNLKDYAGAEKTCQKALNEFPEDPDFYFADCFISLNYQEFDRAIESGLKYLEKYRELNNPADRKRLLSFGREHLIYNYLGVACKAVNDVDRAVEYFEESIKVRKQNQNPYLNLANFYIQLKEHDKAEAVIERGMKDCTQVNELEMLKNTVVNRATVAACMIVKNEEHFLPQCLESIRNWVDEIIVVDTGSTDRTIEIAESYGAKVYHQEWIGDFSYHRNHSIEQASSDWVFIIDADEEVEQADIPKIREALTYEDFRMITMNVYNMDPETGRVSSHLPSIRFFRKESGIRYDGIVHNQLKYDKDEKSLKVEASLRHYGYNLSEDKMEQKFQRTKALLDKQIEEDPDNAFAHFNLGQLYRSVNFENKPNAHDKAIYHAARTIELTPKHKTIHLMAHYQKAAALYKLNRFGEAEEMARAALDLKSNYLDPIILLGHIYIGMGKYKEAKEYYQRYLDAQAEVSQNTLSEDLLIVFIEARYVANYNLGLIEEYTGSPEKAEDYYLLAYREQGAFENICLRLAKIYLSKQELDKAFEFIEEELTVNPDNAEACLVKARILELRGEVASAGQFYEQAVSGNYNDIELARKAGVFFANNKNLERAREIYRSLTDKSSDSAEDWRDLGKIELALGNFDHAVPAFENSLKINPVAFDVVCDLAVCHFRAGNFEKAEELYGRAMESGQNIGFIYRNLGLTKYHLEKYSESLALLEKYLEIAPDDLEIESAIGLCHYHLKEYADCVKHLEKYLRFNPSGVEALLYLADCYRNLGYPDSAVLGYRQVLKLVPDHPEAKRNLYQIETSSSSVN